MTCDYDICARGKVSVKVEHKTIYAERLGTLHNLLLQRADWGSAEPCRTTAKVASTGP